MELVIAGDAGDSPSVGLQSPSFTVSQFPSCSSNSALRQICENGVLRQILGAPRYSPICMLRGEVGTSLMKARIMEGHLQFLRSTMQGSNDLTRKVARLEFEVRRSTWAKTTRGYLESVGMSITELERMSKHSLKKHIRKWDDRQWKEELEAKSSIELYRTCKPVIKDMIYDNTASSVVLFQARSNTLPPGARKRYTDEETTCELCKQGEEDQYHFMLECTQLSEECLKIPPLQHPHPEDPKEVLKHFLFNEDRKNMERNKEGLHQLWRTRKTRPYIEGSIIRRFVYICSADEMTSLYVHFNHE